MALASLVEIEKNTMRTRILDLNFDGLNIAKTPLLIPSFSSQAHIPKHHDLTSCIQDSLSYISDTLLVSAYDIHHKGIKTDFSNLDVLFLDSGGYECIFENDYSDIGESKKYPKEWNKKTYEGTLGEFKPDVPIALVSYDNPREENLKFT